MSLVRLSAATGISCPVLWRYRTGRTVPRNYYGDPNPNAIKIANALGLTIEEFFPVADDEVAA